MSSKKDAYYSLMAEPTSRKSKCTIFAHSTTRAKRISENSQLATLRGGFAL